VFFRFSIARVRESARTQGIDSLGADLRRKTHLNREKLPKITPMGYAVGNVG
jgi:hypothetical protein